MAVNSVFQVGDIWTEVYARISPTPSPLRIVVIPGTCSSTSGPRSKVRVSFYRVPL